MTEIYIFLSVLVVIVIITLGYTAWRRMASVLPRKWHRELILKFRESYIVNGEFELRDYIIENNTITYVKRNENLVGMIKCVNVKRSDLDLLLGIIHNNRVSKIKMRKHGYVVYNGDSYSFLLLRKEQCLLNISNSACEGLSPSDQTRFDALVSAIKALIDK